MHVRVTGDVQGVGYRYFVVREAEALGLRGWVRNADDGTVEALAEGPRSRIESLVESLRSGPAGASVSDVSVQRQAPAGDLSGFRIVY